MYYLIMKFLYYHSQKILGFAQALMMAGFIKPILAN